MNDEVFDKVQAAGRLGGDLMLLAEAAEMFLADHRADVEAIERAIGLRDAQGLARGAHALKGVLTALGAASAAKIALVLEVAGRQEQWSHVPEAGEELLRQLDRLKPLLETFVEETIHAGAGGRG